MKMVGETVVFIAEIVTRSRDGIDTIIIKRHHSLSSAENCKIMEWLGVVLTNDGDIRGVRLIRPRDKATLKADFLYFPPAEYVDPCHGCMESNCPQRGEGC